MRHKKLALIPVLGMAAALASVAPSGASSHREAPLISQDPVADNTDLYMFRDKNDPTKVNVLANFIGLEQPASGPNFNRFGDDVLYEIKLDNDGDVVEDVTYQFRFRTTIANPNTFLYNTGQVTEKGDQDLNIRQTYSIRKIAGGTSTVIANDLQTPPVNVGPRSTPNYPATMAQHVESLPGGGKVFAGQADDPFFVDLGSVFDLLGLRPLNEAHDLPLPNAPGVDGLFKKNVHTIALQLPIAEVLSSTASPSCLTSTSTVNDKSCVVGAYASSSRARVRVLSTGGGQPRNLGRFVQVSRLGIPLVNEVLIPLGKKDLWNASHPKDDVAKFGANILDPEPAKLANELYDALITPPPGGATRTDIIAVLQGAGAGLAGDQLLPPADLLRLNVTTPVSGTENRLGVIGGDPAGFPNGRRLADDVTDIELRLLVGGTPLAPRNAAGEDTNQFPNNALTDGVDANELPFQAQFPYVAVPTDGYSQTAS